MLTPRTTKVIVVCAVAIGLIADQLFRAPVWGINVPLAAALLAAGGIAASEVRRPHWGWVASVFFASMWAVRGSESLLAVDLLAALALASLPLLREAGILLRGAGLVELATAPLRSAWAISIGTFEFAGVVRSRLAPQQGSAHRAQAIAAGALLAVPLVLVFGGLFASADPVFDTAVSSILDGALGPLISHSVSAGALALASAGYLWYVAKPPRVAEPLFQVPTLGGLQVLTPILATVVLFALFIGVQATSLFGGAEFVETTTGLTFAEYARGGFFQLVFASTLVLPLVYYAPAIAGPMDAQGTGRLRALLLVQLGLTALVLASALWRMALYMRAYGLTEDRVNGMTVMLWIAGTLGVFAVTVARGRPHGAAFGSLVAAVLALGALNLINPEATIARYNLAHQNGREIDFVHLARLGGDAVPILASQIELVPEAERCRLITDLRARHVPVEGDWRGWNLARARAHEAATRLAPIGGCPPASTK